ncbi:MAG: hypothetical protein EOP83_36285 [Verrucomicrobiaceae bacterium]|nr:MAG: hypothetical protein EOP83_36285 [Verrucomicrobiaceae bacterium]
MKHKYTPNKPRWSKTKRDIESLFADGLDLQIHANVYTHGSGPSQQQLPRHYAVLDGTIIWDFPHDYLASVNPDADRVIPYPLYPYWKGLGNKSDPASIFRDYIDTPRDELLTREIEHDDHDLGDILRAADRRIGRTRLFAWALVKLPRFDCPARKVLKARFNTDPR